MCTWVHVKQGENGSLARAAGQERKTGAMCLGRPAERGAMRSCLRTWLLESKDQGWSLNSATSERMT